MAKRSHPDLLQVQIALTIKAPPGVKIGPSVLQTIIDKMVNGEELPRVVEVRGIFWRNPNRRGNLSHWRYHSGADLESKPVTKDRYGNKYIDGTPLETSPRGTLQDAYTTLGGALYSGTVTF
jgi:hypothetical protein